MSVQPHIAVSAEQVSERVIVCGEPDRVNRIVALLERPELLADNREYRVMNGQYQGQPITVCSTGIGALRPLLRLKNWRNAVLNIWYVLVRPVLFRRISAG